MDEYRESILNWLKNDDKEASVKNANSIVSKLTDAELATLYLAIMNERYKAAIGQGSQ